MKWPFVRVRIAAGALSVVRERGEMREIGEMGECSEGGGGDEGV